MTDLGGGNGSTGGWLVVTGVEGMLRGEVLLLRQGQEASWGRGSGSTFPLTRSAGYRALSEDPDKLRGACQGVSRQHFRLRVTGNGQVEIEDLSRAGTFLDGRRLTEPETVRDLKDRAHEVRFGKGERLELRWATGDGPGSA